MRNLLRSLPSRPSGANPTANPSQSQSRSRNRNRSQSRSQSRNARNRQAARCIEQGRAMRQEGRLAEALVQFEHALRLAPELPRAHAGYGYTLALVGRLREAIDAYHEAVRLQPGYWRAWRNRGAAYMKTGQADLAVECYQRAALTPDFDLHLFALNYHSERTPDDVFAAHLEWGRRNQQKISATPFRNTRSARRKLRIGYVSGDFWSHAVAICIEAGLAAHGHRAFEIVCYDESGSRRPTPPHLPGPAARGQ